MYLKRINFYDLKLYLKKHSPMYISFLIFLLVGVLFGVIIGLSSDNYLKLLTKDNKLLFSIINGTVSSASLFWKKLIQFIFPMIIIFLLNLNFYLGIFSGLIIAYQGGLLILTIFAIVSTYGFSGVLNVLFVVLPINILYLGLLIFFASLCLKRSYLAKRNKNFATSLKSGEFLIPLCIAIFGVLFIVFVGVVLYPLILKNAIFFIF